MGCWEGWPDSQRRAPAAAAGSWESPPAHPLAETPPWRWCLMLTLQVLKDTSDAQRFAHSRFTTVGQGKALGCTSWHNVVRGPASSRKRDGESKAPPHFSSHVHAHFRCRTGDAEAGDAVKNPCACWTKRQPAMVLSRVELTEGACQCL